MIYIALGANLPSGEGDPTETLRAALDTLPHAGVHPVRVSRFYANPAIGPGAQPDYVNAVAQVRCVLPPAALLARLHAVERIFGRAREARVRWAARPLDLDLIDYGGRVATTPLALPHPRAHLRGFVLTPLRELAPGWRHPASGTPITALIAALPPEMRRLAPV